MKIFIIAGFLGAGKTSLIGEMAKAFAARGMKIAVIENEFSPSGADSTYLAKQGIIVQELAAGCICCQLQIDFLTALEVLEREYAPDAILVEPTGAAVPDQVKETLCQNLLEPPITVAVVDLQRFKTFGNHRYPFLEQTIRVADAIILNKCDLADENTIARLTAETAQLNSTQPHLVSRFQSAPVKTSRNCRFCSNCTAPPASSPPADTPKNSCQSPPRAKSPLITQLWLKSPPA